MTQKLIFWYTWKRNILKQCVFISVSWSLTGTEHMGQIPFWFEVYTHYGFKHWWLCNRIMMAQSLYRYRSIKHHAPQSVWEIIWPHNNLFVNNFVVHDALYVCIWKDTVYKIRQSPGHLLIGYCHKVGFKSVKRYHYLRKISGESWRHVDSSVAAQ